MIRFCRLRVVILLLLCFMASGCGYHHAGSHSTVLNSGTTVWVPFAVNESVSPVAQTVLRRAFYDELHARRGLVPAHHEAIADLVVTAKLVSYVMTPLSYDATDHIATYNVMIDIDIEAHRRGLANPVWKGRLTSDRQFPANKNLLLQRNAEEQALDSASRILINKLISSIEDSF